MVMSENQNILSVRVVDGLSVVDVNAEILLEEGAIGELSMQLYRLVGRDIRLLVNLGNVRYMSAAVLAMLVALHQRVERAQGRLGLCGLDPVTRDMMRICHLDRVFKIYADQGEALSAGLAAGDRP
jgi:anti-anti-sigma factor